MGSQNPLYLCNGMHGPFTRAEWTLTGFTLVANGFPVTEIQALVYQRVQWCKPGATIARLVRFWPVTGRS